MIAGFVSPLLSNLRRRFRQRFQELNTCSVNTMESLGSQQMSRTVVRPTWSSCSKLGGLNLDVKYSAISQNLKLPFCPASSLGKVGQGSALPRCGRSFLTVGVYNLLWKQRLRFPERSVSPERDRKTTRPESGTLSMCAHFWNGSLLVTQYACSLSREHILQLKWRPLEAVQSWVQQCDSTTIA